MNNLFFKIMSETYSNLSKPENTLCGMGINIKQVEDLTASSDSFYLSGTGIPAFVHAAIVELATYGAAQYDVATDDENVVVEYNSSGATDTNSAIFIKKEKTSGKILQISSCLPKNTLALSISWTAALIVAVACVEDSSKEKLLTLLEFLKGSFNDESKSREVIEATSKAYFELAEMFVDTVYSLDEDVMFVGDTSNKKAKVREITQEYINNTDEFDNLVATLSVQSCFEQEPKAVYFTLVSPKDKADAVMEKSKEVSGKDFTISGSRKFTETEQEMMANTAMRMTSYVPTEVAVDMATAFYATNKCSYGSPLRAAMLYGPSGTGKTEMVQYLGYKLGLPVTTFACSANTDENDLLGKPISLGITNDSADGKITYTETELVRAIKNGWIIEIQEAAVVKETAVHQIFNSLFDGTEMVQLPDGSLIVPHPNFIAVFTTNVSYEGCNSMNQSLISRNQFVAEVKLPPAKELVERLAIQLNWPKNKSKEPMETAVRCMEKINEYLREESLEDGSCDFRCIKDWLQMYLSYNEVGINKSLLELAKYSIVPKATLDSEYHDDIYAICQTMLKG